MTHLSTKKPGNSNFPARRKRKKRSANTKQRHKKRENEFYSYP